MPTPSEDVLSTMNVDGSRRWLRPWISKGRYLTWRRVVAYLLMVVFTATPFIKVDGKPALLLDLANREFTIHGVTFVPTESLLLALLLLTIFIGIFLVTALLGRVWCGWGCPQTVYMEFLYRPIERLFEGKSYRTGKPISPLRRAGKYLAFLVVSFYLANTFLAYFVGVEELGRWMTQSPLEHPSSFLVMAVVTILMMADFSWFREQMCTLACPYGRFQSVLLDRSSLIICYDEGRGEPRGRLRKGDGGPARGDCVDCDLCVKTCPTGIDIREGLQMECVACTQCIDACDAVMDKIGKPRGLIRYTSQERVETGSGKLLRPRVVIYPALLAVVLSAFLVVLGGRKQTDVTFLRVRTTPYFLTDSGEVANRVELKLTNKSDLDKSYRIELLGDGLLNCPECPLYVPAGESRSTGLLVVLPPDRFDAGRTEVIFRITDEDGESQEAMRRLLGPLFAGAKTGSG